MHKEKMVIKKASALRYSSEMFAPLIILNGRAEIAQKMMGGKPTNKCGRDEKE